MTSGLDVDYKYQDEDHKLLLSNEMFTQKTISPPRYINKTARFAILYKNSEQLP